MYSELVFLCGCVAKGKRSTRLCSKHDQPVIASTSTKKRTKQTYTDTDKDIIAELCPYVGSASELFFQSFGDKSKAFKYKVIIVPNDFISDPSKNIFRYDQVKPKHIIGNRVVVVGLNSIKILKYLMDKAVALYVHTESPFVFRALKCPDIITTMSFCGSGKFNGKKQKAA